MSVAERSHEIENRHGGAHPSLVDAAGGGRGIEHENGGVPPRHIDRQTAQLDMLARTWIDFQQTRKAMAQRELDDELVAAFEKLENQVSARLTRTLRAHVLWPWLSQFPGLGGAHVALVVGRIGDPRRFPGQRCSEGHYFPPLYAVGSPCPVVDRRAANDFANGDGAGTSGADETTDESDRVHGCPGTLLPPRETTGTRSIWHWAGLHAEADGRAPHKRKGVRCSYEPRVRASFMQPGGICEQIVRSTVPHYADLYRGAKELLIVRVAEEPSEIGLATGDATAEGTADLRGADERRGGRSLRLFEADRIARKIAGKAFLADLLSEWKRVVA